MGLADFIGQTAAGESWADMPSQPVPTVSPTALPEQPSAMASSSDRPGGSIRAEPDFSRIKSTGPFIAFVGNFPYETSEDNLGEFFRGLNVASIRILHDRITHKSRGQGYVEFLDEQSLRHAVGATGTLFLGRPIKIDVAEEKQSHHHDSRSSSNLTSRYGAPGRVGGGAGMERQERYSSGGFDRSEMRERSEQAPMRSSSGGVASRFERADKFASTGFDRSEMHARPERPAPKDETPSDWRRESGNVIKAANTEHHRKDRQERPEESKKERPATAKPAPTKFSDTDFVFRRSE